MASLDDLATADLTAVFAPYNYNGPSIDGSSKRGQGILVPNLNADFGLAFPPRTTFWMHFHFKSGGINGFLVNLNTNGVWQDVFYISGGYIAAYSGNPNLGWTYNNLPTQWVDYIATGTIPITAATWYDFQAEITISPTAGIIKTWIDGVQDFNLSSVRTQAVGISANTVDCISWNGYAAGGIRVDNVVIGDMTGSVNNQAVGQVIVDAHAPVTPNGSDRQWARSTGTDDWPLIDEITITAGTADYLSSSTVGDRTSLHVAALKAPGNTILGVHAAAYLTKQNAGPAGVRLYVLRDGTRAYGGSWYPSFGNWQWQSLLLEQDPITSGPWTEANFNASEFGLERV
jgi:hypothetical protein